MVDKDMNLSLRFYQLERSVAGISDSRDKDQFYAMVLISILDGSLTVDEAKQLTSLAIEQWLTCFA